MDTANPAPQALIYKICPAAAWAAACATGIYDGSSDDLRDGFIHFSTISQLRGTLDKHFSGQRDLLLITIDPGKLGEALKWEPSRGGQLFPHLYGSLSVANAVQTQSIPLDESGRHAVANLDLPEGERLEPSKTDQL